MNIVAIKLEEGSDLLPPISAYRIGAEANSIAESFRSQRTSAIEKLAASCPENQRLCAARSITLLSWDLLAQVNSVMRALEQYDGATEAIALYRQKNAVPTLPQGGDILRLNADIAQPNPDGKAIVDAPSGGLSVRLRKNAQRTELPADLANDEIQARKIGRKVVSSASSLGAMLAKIEKTPELQSLLANNIDMTFLASTAMALVAEFRVSAKDPIAERRNEHFRKEFSASSERLSQQMGQVADHLKTSPEARLRFGPTSEIRQPLLRKLASSTMELLDDHTQRLLGQRDVTMTGSNRLALAYQLELQGHGENTRTLALKDHRGDFSQEEINQAVTEISSFPNFEGKALAGALNRLGLETTCSFSLLDRPSVRTFKEELEAVLLDQTKADTLRYNCTELEESKVHDALIGVLLDLEAAVGSEKFAHALFRANPNLLIESLEYPSNYQRYIDALPSFGPVMVAMHRQGCFDINKFSSLEALRSLWKEAQTYNPTRVATPAVVSTAQEIDFFVKTLSEMGVSHPSLAYIYIRFVVHHLGGYRNWVPEELRHNKARNYYNKKPSARLLSRIEDELTNLGLLEDGRQQGTMRLAYPVGGKEQNPLRIKVNELLVRILQTPPPPKPDVKPEW